MVARCDNGVRRVSFFADLLSTVFDRRFRAAGKLQDDDRSTKDLCHAILSRAGDGSALASGRLLLKRYATMDQTEKQLFFKFLAVDLGLDTLAVRTALELYEANPTRQTYADFMAAAEPKRQELARRLNHVSGATAQLVAMREDLLSLSKKDPELAGVDPDFRHLFMSWFNRGFLVLRPISWASPAEILEKIIAYEAVHAINTWDELRRRLQPEDRRCFGFFHPAMPSEPLIFVEVALTTCVPRSVQALLSEDRAEISADTATTAVFYSISNCQPGLAGISFGNSLIKQVVSDLANELEGLKTFVTLSPVPEFNRWRTEAGHADVSADSEKQRELVAQYLVTSKRPTGEPWDPVARFHLGNGALLYAVHADADLSENGRLQSGGAMVNYLYDLPLMAHNQERFATDYEVVVSAEITALATKTRK